MKYQEALDGLKLECKATYIDDIGVRIYTSDKNADERVRILQELVDKETPMKLIENFGLVCPNCKTEYVIDSPKVYKYCPECGQRWSEEDD